MALEREVMPSSVRGAGELKSREARQSPLSGSVVFRSVGVRKNAVSG
jgi:hypothetical protein